MTIVLVLLFLVSVFGVRVIAEKLDEIVFVLREIKDVSDVILGSIERIERDLQGTSE